MARQAHARTSAHFETALLHIEEAGAKLRQGEEQEDDAQAPPSSGPTHGHDVRPLRAKSA